MPLDPCLWNTETVSLSIAEDAVSLRADVNVSAQYGNDLEARSDGLYVPGPQWVTGDIFPLDVDDGFEVRWRPGGGHVVWRFVYSADDGLWLFEGGPPYTDRVLTSETRVGAGGGSGYNDLTTSGPSMPAFNGNISSGVFDIRIGCRIANGSPPGAGGIMSVRFSGANPIDSDGAYYSGENVASPMNSLRNKTVPAGSNITAKYATVGADNIAFSNRWLEVIPVSVSV